MRSIIIALCLVATPAWAQGNFYEGKTVTVVIGASGGSLEIAARIVARHLGKHIPGNPSVINGSSQALVRRCGSALTWRVPLRGGRNARPVCWRRSGPI